MTMTRYIPQWRQIELALRERIATLTPGDPLPSDAAAVRGVQRVAG